MLLILPEVVLENGYLLNLLVSGLAGYSSLYGDIGSSVKAIVALLPAVLDLLFLGWYLLNLLCSGLASQCLYIATQVKDLLVLLAAL